MKNYLMYAGLGLVTMGVLYFMFSGPDKEVEFKEPAPTTTVIEVKRDTQ